MQDTAAVELVATKLSPPTPPPAVRHRRDLESRIAAAVDDARRRLVVVSAPAGSGKSTLVAAWLAERDLPVAWLQVDDADNDPARFWRYLVAAIGTSDPEVASALQPVVTTAASDPDLLIGRLVNRLVGLGPLVVVLDDYHLIARPATHEAVERFVELAPANVTVVIVGRTDPPFRLGRLRVRGQLTEVRAADLRFQLDDAATLLGPAASSLRDDQIAALCQRTEGWAAGLVLAGMSLAGSSDVDEFVRTFEGADRLVVDYLADEFLAHVDPEEELRLLRTSVLDQMTGPLVDAVLGTDDGAPWLRATSAANQLVIGLDRTGDWFRYHHLLADLLRREAADRIPDELPDLHVRAGRWHAEHGSAHRGVEHLIAGGAMTEAADLIWNHGTELLNGGELRTVGRQVARLGSVADEHPGCLIVTAWIGVLTGRFDDARRAVDRAASVGSDDPVVLGMLDALGIMIGITGGDIASALRIAQSAHEPTESTQVMSLVLVHVLAGRFDEARQLARSARARAADEGHTFVDVATTGYEAVTALEEGDHATAEQLARRAIESARAVGYDEMSQLGPAHTVLGRVTADPDEAVASVRRGLELSRRGAGAVTLSYALASVADVVAASDRNEAERAVREARAIVDRCPDPGIAGPYVARVAAQLGTAPTPPPTGLVEELTDRELAVLHYLPTAMSQREIAAEMYVSLNTVKTHCRAIFRKLGVGDRKSAVQAARDVGLL